MNKPVRIIVLILNGRRRSAHTCQAVGRIVGIGNSLRARVNNRGFVARRVIRVRYGLVEGIGNGSDLIQRVICPGGRPKSIGHAEAAPGVVISECHIVGVCIIYGRQTIGLIVIKIRLYTVGIRHRNAVAQRVIGITPRITERVGFRDKAVQRIISE